MKRHLTWIYGFLTFFCSQLSYSDNQKFTLGDIFCAALIETQPHEPGTKKLNELWPELEKHLENETLFNLTSDEHKEAGGPEKYRHNPFFTKCLEEHKIEFELGQLILSSRKRVRSALEAYKAESKTVLSSATFQIPNGQGFLDSISLTLTDSSSSSDNLKVLQSLQDRDVKYTSMWHRFLSELKTKSQTPPF